MAIVDLDNEFLDLFYNITNSGQEPSRLQCIGSQRVRHD